MYNDPSGEFLGLALWAGAAIIGALIGVASYAIGSYIANGSWEKVSLSGTLKAAFWGAVSGAVTFGIGDCFTTAKGAATAFSKTFGGVLVKAAAHGIAQGTLAMMQNDGAGFLSGASGGFFGSLGATAWGGAGGKWQGIAGKYAGSDVGTIAFGALSGGVGAELSGGNFWQGAIAGGIVAGLNDVMHQQPDPNKQLARRIAKQYGGNVSEIREWLNNHPFVINDGIVSFEGIDGLSVDTNSNNGNSNDMNKAFDSGAKWLIKKGLYYSIKGIVSGGGQLLGDGGLAKTPTKTYNGLNSIKATYAQDALIDYVFKPQGSMQTPNMNNNFKSYSGYSRFDTYYKAK